MNMSKYDHKGNVIYSESLDLEGIIVRHFYKYDQMIEEYTIKHKQIQVYLKNILHIMNMV